MTDCSQLERDILEWDIPEEVLAVLLKDRTTGRNLIWATDDYAERGKGFAASDEIHIEQINDKNNPVIRPRVDKAAEEQRKRVEKRAEVFTAELYEQLKKAGKGGHVELAEAYPNEFIQACKTNSWEMLNSDLARIFTGDHFLDSQKCEILQMYEGCVSDEVVARAAASFITKKNYKKFSTTVLEGVFPYLAQSDLQVLILQRLDPDVAKVKTMLSKMKESYNAILDVKSREKLSLTALNKPFIQFLVDKGLITETKNGADGEAKKADS